jgi:hypothetical protein
MTLMTELNARLSKLVCKGPRKRWFSGKEVKILPPFQCVKHDNRQTCAGNLHFLSDQIFPFQKMSQDAGVDTVAPGTSTFGNRKTMPNQTREVTSRFAANSCELSKKIKPAAGK